jgi:hypothetical protein
VLFHNTHTTHNRPGQRLPWESAGAVDGHALGGSLSFLAADQSEISEESCALSLFNDCGAQGPAGRLLLLRLSLIHVQVIAFGAWRCALIATLPKFKLLIRCLRNI